MVWLGLALLVLIICFGFVLLFGAPYLPTLSKQVDMALDLADLQPGQTLLELGCGDGKVLLAAAKRGYKVVGYELNPLLVIVCCLRTWRYRHLVSVKWANFLTQSWPPAQAIFIFGLQRIMSEVDKKVIQYISKPVNLASSNKIGIKLVSFGFAIPGRTAAREQQGLYLYVYQDA